MPHQRDPAALRSRREERQLDIAALQLVRIPEHAAPRRIAHRIPIALEARHQLRLTANVRLDAVAEADRQRRVVVGAEMHDALARRGVGLLVDVPRQRTAAVEARLVLLDFELHPDDVQRAPEEGAHVWTERNEPVGDAAADELGVVLARVGLDGAQDVGFEGGGGRLAGLELDGVHAEVDGVDPVVDADADLDGGGVEQVGGGAEIEGLRRSAGGLYRAGGGA